MNIHKNYISMQDLVRWIEDTCPEGMLFVQNRQPIAGNEIEWTDAVRRAKAWCAANPKPNPTGENYE